MSLSKPQKFKKPTAKAQPFTYKGVTVNWYGVRVAKATYKDVALEIRANGTLSRALYIEGRKVHSGETITELKEFVIDYLGR